MSAQGTFTIMSRSDTTARPGLGLPLNHYDTRGKKSFPNALRVRDSSLGGIPMTYTMPLLTLREITMLRIMQQITSKPDWNVKVFNDGITAKWFDEATSNGNTDVSSKMMDYIIAELRHKANELEDTPYFTAYDLITISDQALSESFREELNEAVKVLEDVPDKAKDWHPGSDEKVLDVVHPSLFPLVYGRTRALEKPGETVSLGETVQFCGKGGVVPVPTEKQSTVLIGQTTQTAYSRKFQWLPCEVDISTDNSKITSYINNLHPITHKPLYKLIEEVIDASIPLWNSTLSLVYEAETSQRRITYKLSDNYADTFESDDDDDDDDVFVLYDDNDFELEDGNSVTVELPEPALFKPRKRVLKTSLKEKFGSSGLQVIVKLANIELTPEKPEYAGGSWHVEGQLNEHICATSIYYYSNENITPSALYFRQQVDTKEVNRTRYQPHAADLLPLIYGASSGDSAVQVLGGVATLQNRLLAFPNVLQHQVQPFKLEDPTKKGHCKIITLFLVDPHIKIISTANVPCQRLDWWKEEMKSTPSGLDRLPVEVREEVFKGVEEFPISLEEAKELRLELMEERKGFEIRQNDVFHSLRFSLRQH